MKPSLKLFAILVLSVLVSIPAWADGNRDRGDREDNSGSHGTGGSAAGGQGGSVTGGNSTNSNTNTATGIGGQGGSVSGSGNSSNTNTNSAAGGTGGTASNNGNGSNNSVSTTTVTAPDIPVSTAYAPSTFPTVPCFKTAGIGIQTGLFGGSFGGGRVDTGCDQRELARSYFSIGARLAGCKILVNNKRSQESGVTLADCLQSQSAAHRDLPAAAPVMIPADVHVTIQPTPVTIIQPAPVAQAVPTPIAQAPVKAPVKRRAVVHCAPVCRVK
jgi:hypothetical protein